MKKVDLETDLVVAVDVVLIAALTLVTKLLTLQRDVLDVRLACSAANSAGKRRWTCHPGTACGIQCASA